MRVTLTAKLKNLQPSFPERKSSPGKPENQEKNPPSTRTNNKLNPHMTPGLGIEPGPQRWEASALTTTPDRMTVIQKGEVRVIPGAPGDSKDKFS